MLEMMGNEGQPISPQPSGRRHAKILLVVLALFLMFLSGICGYLIGVTTTKNVKSQLAARQTPAAPKDIDTPTPMIMLHCLGSCPTPPGATARPIIPPVTPPLPTPSPDPETATWQTYADPTYGFSFKYPPEWTDINGYSNPIRFTIINNAEPKRTPMQVAIWTDDQNTQTVNQWFQTRKNSSSTEPFIFLPSQQITIAGYPAIRTAIGNAFALEDDFIVAPSNSTLTAAYELAIIGNGEGYDQPYSETEPFVQQEIVNFHLMLSTFRFP